MGFSKLFFVCFASLFVLKTYIFFVYEKYFECDVETKLNFKLVEKQEKVYEICRQQALPDAEHNFIVDFFACESLEKSDWDV